MSPHWAFSVERPSTRSAGEPHGSAAVPGAELGTCLLGTLATTAMLAEMAGGWYRSRMRLSKKAEYALRAMIAMGRRGHGRPVAIQELSEAERIPVKFLEHILLELKKSGLLRSKRGVGGGYLFNRSLDEISLGEIVEVIDGPFLPMACVQPGTPGRCGCGQPKPCGLGATFGELQGEVDRFLAGRSVADVIRKESQSAPNFEI